VHVKGVQQDVAQSPALSALSPAGTHVTHVPCVASQTKLVAHSVLRLHVVPHAVVLPQA
jgi:hypothetical protein